MKTKNVLLLGIGVALGYLSYKKYMQNKHSTNEQPTSGKIIFTDVSEVEPKHLDSLPQPPDINIILPK